MERFVAETDVIYDQHLDDEMSDSDGLRRWTAI